VNPAATRILKRSGKRHATFARDRPARQRLLLERLAGTLPRVATATVGPVKQDRESWRARLRQYAGARQVTTSARDGWLSLDDRDEYDELSRWPVLSDDFVRGPPSAAARESA
jgi:hypothetical protein